MSELKRCPFCGGEAKVFNDRIVANNAYIVECTDCGCAIGEYSKTPELAIKAWNTRKQIDDIVERLESIEDAIYNQRLLIGDKIYKDKDAHMEARKLIYEELAYNNAIKIVKEEGGLNG